MSGIDLSTKQGALRFCELRRAEMEESFRRVGRFETNGAAFCAWAFMTHEILAPKDTAPPGWKTGRRLDGVRAALLPLPKWMRLVEPDRAKDVYSEAIRWYAKLGRAVGTVFMTETWFVTMNMPEGAPDPRADAQKQRDALPDSLEDAPGRREGLMLWLEHSAAGSIQWSAEIRRDPDGLDAWKERWMEAVEGRFVNLVDVRN